MNIAVIVPSLKNKAPIQVAKDIVKQLLTKGCSVDVFYFEDVVEVDFNCYSRRINLWNKINFKKYDVIHSHMLRPDFYIWLHRNKIEGVCVSTLHNEIDKILKNDYNYLIAEFFTKLWVSFLKSHNEVICLSKVAQKQLSIVYNFKNLDYIYNGRSVSDGVLGKTDIGILLDKKKEYILLGVIANISEIKGINQIIDSLVKLEDYCLVVIGDGPEREKLEDKVLQLNLGKRCVFFGHRENAHQFLYYIDIYMMTSFSEGFPLVLIEAAQYKKPTVCSHIPIFKEFFSKDEVVYFELNNVESLVCAIKEAYKRKDVLSRNIGIKYLKSYTLEIMGNNYFKKFKSLLKEKNNV
jgi:glycosyltransferase involved in cell wall biosynthesis